MFQRLDEGPSDRDSLEQLGCLQLGAAGFPDLFKCWTLVAFLAPREEFFVVLVRVSAVIQKAFAVIIALSFHVEGDSHVLFARWIVR